MTPTPGNPYEQAAVALPQDDFTNPYLGAAAAPPDLDAGAPSLRNAEQQRVNRKALLFLAGIVLLLAMMAVLVLRGTKKDETAKPTEEQVSIPTLADANAPAATSGAAEAVAPIPVETAPPDLPPLPPQTYADMPPPPPPGYAPPQSARPLPPTLLERRMGVEGAGGAPAAQQDAYAQAVAMTQAAMGGGAARQESPTEDARRKATRAQRLRNPDALLVRGTYLRCVLETRIVTDVPGFTSCILTEPAYSINGRSRLLERGSKIYGSYEKGPRGDRVEVVWDRITTPSGVDVSMSSPGVDGLGGAGMPGMRDSHWPSRITSALMISLLSDAFKYAAAENGPSTATVSQGVVVVSPYESNTARTMDRLANQAADEAISRPPTVTINQGTVVNVYIARDVDFSEVVAR